MLGSHRLSAISPVSRDKVARWLCVHGALACCAFKFLSWFPVSYYIKNIEHTVIGNLLKYTFVYNCRNEMK